MIRLFEQHKVRVQKELEGMWNVEIPGKGQLRLPVPGCWEQQTGLEKYRGKVTYYKKVSVAKETNLRLEFKGVSHTADVYFDDAFVVHHYNAFTPFSGVVRQVKPGEHTIRVEVDNSFSEESALHIANDYYTYGGITRPVALEEIADTYVKYVHVTPKMEQGKWNAQIEVCVENLGEQDKEVDILCQLVGVAFGGKLKLASGELGMVQLQQNFNSVTVWSQENPQLYELTVSVSQNGTVVDDYIDRVGFREITLQKNRVLLNGKPIFLKGFNRHEDYGMMGCAIPLQLMVQDLDLMQDMGANAVRTCHYPNDERFLDLCDERGVLVWEENHARGLSLEQMQNPHFEKQCEDCINEMIENHYNHPSIFIWGILNECASETLEGRGMYQKQLEQIKKLDPNRPTTFATCRHFIDVCLDLPDVVSFNIYSGWYQDIGVKERHEQEMDWIATTGGDGKPIIVSEFGAAAIYGYRDRARSKWSEERQVDVIRENFEVYQQDDRLSGVFIWQFADCRVTEEGGWFATRARSHNNKGVVDEYRRPKEAYELVKDWYHNWGKK